MENENQWGKFKKSKILLTAAVILIAAVVVLYVVRLRGDTAGQKESEKGVRYLTELEEQDVAQIEAQIRQVRAQQTAALADSDEKEIWRRMQNAVILGDSRAVGFSFFEFLPENRVFAKSGGRITDVPEYIEQLKNQNLQYLFLCFGLNDVGIGFWPTTEEYDAAYEEQMQLLLQELPDTQIYINSILPAEGDGLNADSDYQRIGEYNEGLRQFCEEHGYCFVDNTQIAETHVDLYEADGLHLKKEFYKYWAANMLTEVEKE